MKRTRNYSFNFDWLTILFYLLLISFGWVNILSASHEGDIKSYTDLSQPFGKQILFIGVSFFVIVFILSIEAKFYERFSGLFYLGSILLLLGLFVFGKNVNGATSWYGIGGITIQPSEFTKFTTALALSKYISDFQTNLKSFKHQLQAITIILLPAVLILLQNDAGSTLVYASFFFVFYREGIQQIYLSISVFSVILAILVLKFGVVITLIITTVILILLFFLQKKRKVKIQTYLYVFITAILFSLTVKLAYQYVLKPHQQNRISLWLRLEKDPEKLKAMKRVEAYNLIQSEEAISSGGLLGKGLLQGTRTKGKYVPEQHTDYIFSTVGEEWGFVGSSAVVLLFVFLIGRLVFMAERQKNQFSRIYGYGVASIIFFHFVINIGMVMGLIPTIGIPLPFLSYGGSSLLGFTILLFIFIKLDANRLNEW